MASSVATTIDALHTHLLALSTLGPLEEYSLGATQGLVVSQIGKAITELGKIEAYSISRPLVSLIVDVAQRDGIAVADEIFELATDMSKLALGAVLLTPEMSWLTRLRSSTVPRRPRCLQRCRFMSTSVEINLLGLSSRHAPKSMVDSQRKSDRA